MQVTQNDCFVIFICFVSGVHIYCDCGHYSSPLLSSKPFYGATLAGAGTCLSRGALLQQNPFFLCNHVASFRNVCMNGDFSILVENGV